MLTARDDSGKFRRDEAFPVSGNVGLESAAHRSAWRPESILDSQPGLGGERSSRLRRFSLVATIPLQAPNQTATRQAPLTWQSTPAMRLRLVMASPVTLLIRA
jgi:hypothetical protein